MKRLFAGLALLTFAAIALAGCAPNVGEGGAVAIATTESAVLQVVFLANNASVDDTDVYLQDPDTNEMTFFGTISGVDNEWGFAHEYVNGQFYYVKRNGDDQAAGWTDELWRLDADGQQTQLYASQGLTFSVSPTGEYIAVSYVISLDTFQSGLLFLDPRGDPLQALPFEEVNPDYALSLGQWSDDEGVFWVSFHIGPGILTYARVSVPDWGTMLYDTSAFAPQTSEAALEPNTGQLVYSDMPAHFDVISAQEFLVSQQPVTLYLHNLDSGASFSVATSAARAFHPEWLDDGRFAYDAPEGSGGRATYQVLSGEITIEPGAEAAAVHPAIIPPNFEGVMAELLGTGVAVMLPPSFPVDGDLGTYPYVISAMDGKYEVSLGIVEDCMDTGACTYGHLVARRIGAAGDAYETIMPFWDAAVSDMPSLVGNIPSYFVDYQCGANCGDAMLFWIYNDCEYMLGLRAGSEETLIELANAMLQNSVPVE